MQKLEGKNIEWEDIRVSIFGVDCVVKEIDYQSIREIKIPKFGLNSEEIKKLDEALGLAGARKMISCLVIEMQ